MGKQRAEFTIWTKGENRHLVRVELPRNPATGQRRRVSRIVHGTRADAKRFARQMLSEREQGVDLSPKKVTLADWMARWVKRHHAEGHISDAVNERYLGIIHKHIIPAVGHVPLTELRADQIADLKDAWLSGESPTVEAPLSPATVYKHLVVLRRALREAVTASIITRSPTDPVSTPSLKGNLEQRALDEEEVVQLLQAAKETRYDVPIRFTLATGLRLGEMLNLTWEDLDLDARLLHCRGTKSTKSRRTIELSEATVSQLRSHRQEQLEERLRLGGLWKELGLVFPSGLGTRRFRSPFRRGYKQVIYRSGLRNPDSVTWHTLRHTAASQWIRRGVDIFTVSRRLGHASAAFTMDVYGHLLKGQQEQAARALDEVLARA